MFQAKDPIGVMDSGIGGFSVARQVQRLLPGEDLVYFGDGANVPYGNHSRERIMEMTRYILDYMEGRKVKALLTACNTISCVVYDCSEGMSCPVFSVVRAGADAAAALDVKKVGVISTVFTDKTQCYPREITIRRPRTMKVVSHGCRDLANLVEHSLADPAGMDRVEEELRRELRPLVERDKIQALVLGCTHYPLVEDSIRKLYPDLPLIDPAVQMAKDLQDYLDREGLRNSPDRLGELEIVTTGNVEEYALWAGRVGLERVSSVSHYPPMELPEEG